MVFSMLSDVLNLMTSHLFLFYRIAARLYHWQTGVLGSLFNLFRGRCTCVAVDRWPYHG